MQRFLSLLAFAVLLVPSFASAEGLTDVYADAVFTKSALNLLTPENAIGAPDGRYADFRAKDAFVTLDMGEGEEGYGNLVVTMRVLDNGATGWATLYDENWAVLSSSGLPFPAAMKEWTVSYDGATPYRYVRIESMKSEQWSLDAVQATQVNTPAAPTEPSPEPTETIPYCTTDCGLAGQLVKIDGNSSVYFIGKDGMRHAFPNASVFASWGYDFADVETVSADVLASYQLGKNVTVRPGTYMVKIVHDPKTYAVEPGGILRWVSSEAIAQALYGASWNERIVDIDETFWRNYSVGAPILDASLPPLGYVFGYNIGTIGDDDPNTGFYIVTVNGDRLLNHEETLSLRMDAFSSIDVDDVPTNKAVSAEDNSDLVVFVHPY
jgi:hypothetical protein